MIKTNGILSEDEVERLLAALEAGEGREVSEEELQDFVTWAGKVRLNLVMLDEVLAGHFGARRFGADYGFKPTAAFHEQFVQPSPDTMT